MVDITPPVPDWYPDPDGSSGERWWDGEQWTSTTRGPISPGRNFLPNELAADWYDDPVMPDTERWWDGRQWTKHRRISTSGDADRDQSPIAARTTPSTPPTSNAPRRDSPGTPEAADWYDDPNGSGGERWWDGVGWTSLVRSSGSSVSHELAAQSIPRTGLANLVVAAKERPLVTVAAVVVVVSVLVGAAVIGSKARRWSQFPHSASCRVSIEAVTADWPLPPAVATADQVALSHLEGDSFKLVISFAASGPTPGTTYSPYTGEVIDSPGSIRFWINVSGRKDDDGGGSVVSIFSPRDGRGWVAFRGDFAIQEIIDEPVPDHPIGNLLTSVKTTSSSVELTLNLEGQPEFFPDGAFTPDVAINADEKGYATPYFPTGDATPFRPQRCDWG